MMRRATIVPIAQPWGLRYMWIVEFQTAVTTDSVLYSTLREAAESMLEFLIREGVEGT